MKEQCLHSSCEQDTAPVPGLCSLFLVLLVVMGAVPLNHVILTRPILYIINSTGNVNFRVSFLEYNFSSLRKDSSKVCDMYKEELITSSVILANSVNNFQIKVKRC